MGEQEFKSLGARSGGEFYTNAPAGYKPGKVKYIIVVGTVMSGLGKGIVVSSVSKLLQSKGYKVSPMKFDGYLNVDAGTLSPYRHGEVFVLDDTTECDMDLGTYERFLDKNLTKENYLTAGKLYSILLQKERRGEYLGRDVQVIPHLTGEIKGFIRDLGVKSKADIVLVEVGGTIGDIENNYFIEAMRELRYEEGKENVYFVALTYVMHPQALGEQKSKAAQLGIRSLMSMGVQPDLVVCRSEKPLEDKIREKVSIYSNLPVSNVIDCHDVPSIYKVPNELRGQKVDEIITKRLGLNGKPSSLEDWEKFVAGMENPKNEITIAITGKYTLLKDSYASILKAIEHCAAFWNTRINLKWIETTEIEKGKQSAADALAGVHGVIVPGGFGIRGIEGKIKCVEYVRKKKIPYLGLCLGFQTVLIEYARNICGLIEANSTEIDPKTKDPVIDILPEQKKIDEVGGTLRLGGQDVLIKRGSLAYELYDNKEKVRERFRHRYECNPKYIKTLEENGMIFSGCAPKGNIMQILELPKAQHPYFLATQFHPEFTSRPMNPNPCFRGFIEAAIANKNKMPSSHGIAVV